MLMCVCVWESRLAPKMLYLYAHKMQNLSTFVQLTYLVDYLIQTLSHRMLYTSSRYLVAEPIISDTFNHFLKVS